MSILGRSSLELLRILPGVVAPDQSAFESVSFGGGANNTQGYTVNGIRSSGNTVQLDGSSLIDIGSNSGVIVTLNNDMVQEVKVQSSNFAAEYGTGGMNVSAITKGGSSKFSGTLYDYNRHHKFAANDRSNSITGTAKPPSKFNYPGGNIGGPIIIPGVEWNSARDKAFFFVGFEVQRQKVDTGSFLSTTLTDKMKAGDLSEQLPGNCVGQNLNMTCAQSNIPRGFPGAGTPAPGNQFQQYMQPMGEVLSSLYPSPNLVDPTNRYNYVFNTLQPANRTDLKMRFDYNISNNTKAYVRAAIEGEETENARGIWWSSSDLALPTPSVGTNKGRSVSGNVVSVLSPTMTNEVLVSWSRLTLDNTWRDPAKMSLSSYPELAGYSQGFFPNAEPVPAAQHHHLRVGPGRTGQPVGAGDGRLRLQRRAAVLRQAHQDRRQSRPEVRLLGRARAEAAELREQRVRRVPVRPVGDRRHRRPRVGPADRPSGQLQPGHPHSRRAVALLELRRLRAGQLEGQAKPHGRVRRARRLLDQQRRAARLRRLLRPDSRTTPVRARSSTRVPGRRSMAGSTRRRVRRRRAESTTAARLRCRASTSRGTSTARATTCCAAASACSTTGTWATSSTSTLRVPPISYRVGINSGDGSNLGGGVGLNYDTIGQLDWETRVGSIGLDTLNPDSNKWPKTYSYSVSYARRIFYNQVIEAAYVGTKGRDLVSRRHLNAVPLGAMLSGTVNGVDLSVPINRVPLADSVVNSFRPFPAFTEVRDWSFEGESDYNSLQVTLSRQTGRRLQYFAAYTFAKAKGTTSGNGEYGFIDPFDPTRTYGVLPEDRTHIFNLSWNAFLPDGARGALDNAVMRPVLNGWQLSGISTLASGVPVFLGFGGQLADDNITQATFGTPDIIGNPGPGGGDRGGFSPVYTCDPRLDGSKVGEKMFDINCIGIPPPGTNGDLIPPYNLRMPTRINHDLTVFKNFAIHGDQKIQFRVGFFNLFNQAWVTTNSAADIDLVLNTECNVSSNGISNGAGGTADNVCDPTGDSGTPRTRSTTSGRST